MANALHIKVANGSLEVTTGGPDQSSLPTICAAHPAGVFGESAVKLLSELPARASSA